MSILIHTLPNMPFCIPSVVPSSVLLGTRYILFMVLQFVLHHVMSWAFTLGRGILREGYVCVHQVGAWVGVTVLTPRGSVIIACSNIETFNIIVVIIFRVLQYSRV